MGEHKLNIKDFELDEIVSIELIGEEETIDITVDDTHMFYANDIYTHNSSVSSELVTGDQMGGSIKKAQIGHFIMSVAKTLPQKESGRATIAVLKSRFGKDGVVFENCIFDNGTVTIDTEVSETFLGYEQKVEQAKEDKARERIKRARELREGRKSNTSIDDK